MKLGFKCYFCTFFSSNFGSCPLDQKKKKKFFCDDLHSFSLCPVCASCARRLGKERGQPAGVGTSNHDQGMDSVPIW